MKNFDDFKTTISQEKLNEWYSECDKKIEGLNLDNLFSEERSLNLGMTFKLLEEYHKWLND